MTDKYAEDLEKLIEEKDQRIEELEALVSLLEEKLESYRKRYNKPKKDVDIKSKLKGMTNDEALDYLKKRKIL